MSPIPRILKRHVHWTNGAICHRKNELSNQTRNRARLSNTLDCAATGNREDRDWKSHSARNQLHNSFRALCDTWKQPDRHQVLAGGPLQSAPLVVFLHAPPEDKTTNAQAAYSTLHRRFVAIHRASDLAILQSDRS